MEARFRFSVPESAQVTLTLTAPVSEWRQIKDALDQTAISGVSLDFARKLSAMITSMSDGLATQKWTTGYATGDVDAGAERPE